jgi:hypothetical protein
VCKCVLPPGDNPIAVNKYIITYHLLGVAGYAARIDEQGVFFVEKFFSALLP